MTDLTTVDAVRAFNRFYTQRIGALDEQLYGAGFTLAEGRVLYELSVAETSATALSRALGMDQAYLSRILKSFREKGWVAATPCPDDARRSALSLTAAGRAAYAPLLERSRAAVRDMLKTARPDCLSPLLAAMEEIRAGLDDEPPAGPVVLRAFGAADLGWLIDRHGALYAEEHGFDARFAGLVAEIAGAFVRTAQPERSRGWIAEAGGRRVGSVLLTQGESGATAAQLRLLLVEPQWRGKGVGRALLAAATEFARRAGYAELRLWTNHVLLKARRLYETAGFRLINEARHEMFGPPLIGQTWTLDLASAEL